MNGKVNGTSLTVHAELCQHSLPCLSSSQTSPAWLHSPKGGIWPCTSLCSRLRYLLRAYVSKTRQKRTGGTWDHLGHSQDILSSLEDGMLQASLCHADLRCKRRAVSSRRGKETYVPKGTLQTLGPCWQDPAMPREAPPLGVKAR